ncbi:MAG: inorganic pyrophosphatase/exopolyphosphatase [Psychroserpens sp.]|jgi:inorganic pyrophosphatase/exopolyphosphatase
MDSYIVTSGAKYMDIDAFSCSLAMSQLLTLIGRESYSVHTAPLNHSITASLRKMPLNYETNFSRSLNRKSQFIIVDTSDPDHFENFVDVNRIHSIYDHHFGHENYWQEKLGVKSKIEPVGACATLIVEEFQAENIPISQLNNSTRILLLTAIVSNTLNFRSFLTTDRDRSAYLELLSCTILPDSWIPDYYAEIDAQLQKDIDLTIRNDTKEVFIGDCIYVIGQLEVWDSSNLLGSHLIESFLANVPTVTPEPVWFLVISDIQNGSNRLLTRNNRAKEILEHCLDAKFIKDEAITERLWMRKEIIREIQEWHRNVN